MRPLSRLGLLNGSGWESGGTLNICMSFRWLCLGLSGGLKKRRVTIGVWNLVVWAEMRMHSESKTNQAKATFNLSLSQPPSAFTPPTSLYTHQASAPPHHRLHCTYTRQQPHTPLPPPLPSLSPIYSSSSSTHPFSFPLQTGVCNRPVPRDGTPYAFDPTDYDVSPGKFTTGRRSFPTVIQIVCLTSAWESDFEGGFLTGAVGGVVRPPTFLSFRWLPWRVWGAEEGVVW